MSVRASSHVWKCSASKGHDKLTLLAIANYAQPDGTAWPSVSRLAMDTGISQRGVQYALKRLQEKGELTILPGGGPRGTNMYQVNLKGCTGCTGANRAPVQSTTSEGCKLRHEGGAACAPKPLVEPSVEPSVLLQQPKPTVPQSLKAFHGTLSGRPGYSPTTAFFEKVEAKYGTLDLEEEALKAVDWLRSQEAVGRHRKCSVQFLLNWLARTEQQREQRAAQVGTVPHNRKPDRSGRGRHV